MRAIRGDTTTELVTNKHLTTLNAAEACVRGNGKYKGTNTGQEGMMGGDDSLFHLSQGQLAR
jgi:hypothetical protein